MYSTILVWLDPSLLGEKEKSEFAPDKDLLTVCDTLGAAMASQTKNISLRIRSIDLFMEEREALLRRCEGKPAVEFAKEYRQFRDNRIGISGTYDFGSLDVETQAEEIGITRLRRTGMTSSILQSPMSWIIL